MVYSPEQRSNWGTGTTALGPLSKHRCCIEVCKLLQLKWIALWILPTVTFRGIKFNCCVNEHFFPHSHIILIQYWQHMHFSGSASLPQTALLKIKPGKLKTCSLTMLFRSSWLFLFLLRSKCSGSQVCRNLWWQTRLLRAGKRNGYQTHHMRHYCTRHSWIITLFMMLQPKALG